MKVSRNISIFSKRNMYFENFQINISNGPKTLIFDHIKCQMFCNFEEYLNEIF